MNRNNIELKIFGLIMGMAAAMVLVAAGLLFTATRQADLRERQYEQTLVSNGLRQRGKEVQTSLNPYVIWDEAIHKLDNDFDLAWANQNIGASIGGAVRIGPFSSIGIGASVIQEIHIGEHVVIGAGAAVVRDIPDCVVAHGVPAVVKHARTAGERYLGNLPASVTR